MNRLRSILSLSLAILLCLSMMVVPHAAAATAFSDVGQDHIYYAAIQWANENGLMKGYGDGTFQPQNPITRAELYQVLANACAAPKVEQTEGGHWAQPAADYLAAQGFIQAADAELDVQVTRAEAISTIYTVVSHMGIAPLTDEDPGLTDAAYIPAEYAENVKAAYRSGIIEHIGNSKNCYPNGQLGRSDLCNLLYATGLSLPMAPTTSGNQVTANVYNLDEDGRPVVVQQTPVSIMTVDGKTYYNVSECAKLAGKSIMMTANDKSSLFYQLDADGERIYNVAALVLSNGNERTELCNNYCYTVKTDNTGGASGMNTPFILKGEDLYMPATGTRFVTDWAIVNTDGTLNILDAQGKYPKFIEHSDVSDSTKNQLLAATWLVYNVYPDGYETLVTNTKRVAPMTQAKHDSISKRIKAQSIAGYAQANSDNTVYIREDILNDYPADGLAPILVHEATHYQEFTKGSHSETVPTVEQIKTIYSIYKTGSHIYKTAKSCTVSNDVPGMYDEGIAQGQAWIDQQEGIIAAQ